jgi:hypothetical protein
VADLLGYLRPGGSDGWLAGCCPAAVAFHFYSNQQCLTAHESRLNAFNITFASRLNEGRK